MRLQPSRGQAVDCFLDFTEAVALGKLTDSCWGCLSRRPASAVTASPGGLLETQNLRLQPH